ncbi:MAG: helix-turn-helix transcriptional regulator [Sporomusaceae bacterium]|nr:helix-turn-helix transcriptional regulator [Sporomusaceae bacterium]
MASNSLTPKEAAAALNITKNTIYEMVKRGELTAYRIGRKIRIEEKDITAYKEKMRPLSLSGEKTDAASFIICGQDMILDILARYLANENPGAKILRSHQGSYNGLFDLYNDRANAATAHLWDGETDTYNTVYVKSMLPGVPAQIIPLVKRTQGFYVAKGNPKNISGWDDFKREDLVFVNREKGSGTRVLLDEKLRLLAINPATISGYGNIASSHVLIATTIARGLADFGIGVAETTKQVKGLKFIPLQKECYDLVVKRADLTSPLVVSMLKIIASDEFKSEVLSLGGYEM